ncbi:hypothetical protein CKAH01_15048 [Colletotrichum kahawae]|uniref:Uncharacterized protein n=1 Tax=Colletotrichum kahawae TaxID=34407 RepID=A0AAD9YIB2_COLKA|nr:hypothetical protein CKAH01_15048 [Colletotrichum kahawae]
MGVLMPVTEPIADMPSPLLPGAGSPLGTRRLAAECGRPLLGSPGGSDTSKILSYSLASNILLRKSQGCRLPQVHHDHISYPPSQSHQTRATAASKRTMDRYPCVNKYKHGVDCPG